MAAVLEHTVTKTENGKSFERIMRGVFGISSGLMKELKLNGRIFINGAVCRSVDLACAGDVLSAQVEENTCADGIVPYPMALDVLFEDDYITVINKPGGINSHPCMNDRETTLANGMMHYWAQNGEYHNYHIVNRLDKDTSGLCVIAKNRYAHSKLTEQISAKTFKRQYTAVVHGKVVPSCGSIRMPIKRDENSVIKRVAAPDGKCAETVYRTSSVIGNKFSVLDIELKTGRTHQIRVHFSHIGHPLVGDWLYGNGDNEKNLILRHALHAGRLSFNHPVSGEKMKFSTEMPCDIKELLLKIKF